MQSRGEPQQQKHTSSSRIIPKHRPRFKTVPIWPAVIEEDAARDAMRAAREGEDPSGALYWAQILLRCRPTDEEARDCEVLATVALEELYLGWLGGWERIPSRVIAAAPEPGLDLEPEEDYVLMAIDGQTSLRDVASYSPMCRLEVLKLVFRLEHAGVLVLY